MGLRTYNQNEIEWTDNNCKHDFEKKITEVFFFAGGYYHKMNKCKKCGKYASSDMIEKHSSGNHKFTIPKDNGFLKCEYCDLQINSQPVIHIGGE